MNDQPRTAAGSPEGGQYAAVTGAESTATLDAEPQTPEPRVWAVGDKRHLPTGTWRMVNPDCWMKLCGKCGGTGYLPGYEMIDGARCWGCMRRGYAPGVRMRSTKELDAKESADARRAAQQDAERRARIERAAEDYAARAEERRVLEEAQAAERQARYDRSRHLDASEGAKVTIAGTVVVARDIDVPSYSGYGLERKRVIVIETPDGARAKTFTTAAWAWSMSAGNRVEVNATVKAHGEYDGLKETTVTRVKPTSPIADKVG